MTDPLQNFFARLDGDPLAWAFERPTMGGAMADRASGQARASNCPKTWSELWRLPVVEPLAAYVNVPFCPTFCSFCGFRKSLFEPEAVEPYLTALLKELELEGAWVERAGLAVSALFVGGGTPAVWPAEDLSRLLAGVKRFLPLAPGAELTMEGRLSVLTADKVQALRAGGVNRLSLGVQSFDADVRRRAGRLDPPEKIVAQLEALTADAELLTTVDLIYGLPGQSLEIFQRDLRLAASLSLDGVSCYMLKVMPGSALAAELKSGRGPELKSPAELSQYFRLAVESLGAAGFEQVSGNHWRRNPADRNLYNQLSMGRRDLLGFGAGAGGLAAGRSYVNHADLGLYRAEVDAGRKPLAAFSDPPPRHEILDAASRAVHEGRLDRRQLREAAGRQAGLVDRLTAQWTQAGLLSVDGEELKLTMAGTFWRANLEKALRAVLALGAEA
ncbi:MAG: radical SAM protein [Deltaproteobacteria bacterium]|jgi:oxygen-independent coproporphyrinogen-3 oxidase|nr:radical SAM protein [Deltaproteobacteria bacterium]